MQTDTNLIFTGGNTSAAQTIGAASVRSAGILDLATGLMNTGTTYAAPPLSGGNYLINTSLLPISEDLGPGALRLRFAAIIGAAFTGGTSLNIQVQGAPDASGGTYPANLASLVWTTYAETGAIPVANLGTPAAAGVIPRNSMITIPDFPDVLLNTAMPRFISLNYVPAGIFITGALSFAGIMTSKPDFQVGKYVGGFTVAA